MPRKPTGPPPPAVEARQFNSAQEIDQGIAKLDRRIRDLEQLDVRQAVLEESGEDKVVRSNIRETIREVFGANSPEFQEHQHLTFWAGPVELGMSSHDVVRARDSGRKQAVTILKGLIARLEEKRGDLAPGASPAPAGGGLARLVASIEELRDGLERFNGLLGTPEGEHLRSELMSLWGEIGEDVAALNVPLEWHGRGLSGEVLRFKTFDLALRAIPANSVTRDSIAHAIQSLEAARGRIRKRMREGPPQKGAPGASLARERTNEIFVVHGHDEALLQAVARLLGKLDLKAIVLKEQPNRGSRALIEKFEAESSSASYAIVLLTPDDVGGKRSPEKTPELRPRARQNVVLELGYFMGALGRENVCTLHSEEMELPSDYAGVAYTKADSGWELNLARELAAAGFEIDLNKLR
jgi:predicted nucleotide-binding protein